MQDTNVPYISPSLDFPFFPQGCHSQAPTVDISWCDLCNSHSPNFDNDDVMLVVVDVETVVQSSI